MTLALGAMPPGQLLATPNTLHSCARRIRHCRRRGYGSSQTRAGVSDAAEGPTNEGNPALQENLVHMVRLQIGQEKVKESVEVERQKLQDLAEEAKEEVDRLSQLTKDRSTLAFGSAIADINQEADQFEEILRKNRAKMEAASRELADWELQTARARNEGTFFKGLFKADILQQPCDESRAAHQEELSAEGSTDRYSAGQHAAAKDTALKQSSKVLKYSFGFLSLTLLGGALGDVFGGSATLALDGRNALLGLVLAYAALRASQYNGE